MKSPKQTLLAVRTGAMDFNENFQLIEDDEENSEFNLTGFSFGNIDADGKLDANFLDAEAQRQLSSLGKFGLLSIVNDITEEENRSVCSHREEIVTKSPSAEDFSDICEVIEVDPCPVVGDSSLMPPPVVPVITNKVVHRVKRNVKTPLASLLPSRYADVDVQELFPHFEPGKILRFSKIFPPARPPIWHRVTKPRKQQDDFTAKTEQNRETKLNVGPAASLDQCDTILEDKFLKPLDSDEHPDEGEDPNTSDSNEPGTGTRGKFDYLFEKRNETEVESGPFSYSDDAYFMLTQKEWELDVIWNADGIKKDVMDKLNAGQYCGWVPKINQISRHPAVRKVAPVQPATPASAKGGTRVAKRKESPAPDMSSIFSVENDELVYGRWENDVIWDAENIELNRAPRPVVLDANDDQLILGIPDDVDPKQASSKQVQQQVKAKTSHPHGRKTKQILGKAGVINVHDEEELLPPPPSPERNTVDPYNISNDEYYAMRVVEPSLKDGNMIQHSTPVLELHPSFVPTYHSPAKLRNFPRQPLKRFTQGPMSSTDPQPVHPLVKHIREMEEEREAERTEAGGCHIFFMRTPEDLSGRDGNLILLEYSEQFPPLLNQIGMCSRIKNFYKRTASRNNEPPPYKYGETVYVQTSPFLGSLHPGQSLQAVENNMYRAPIYEHKAPVTDFLVIRTPDCYYIREIDVLYAVGQQCPLYEVPPPNSKRTVTFMRDFVMATIYRQFWKSTDTPRRIRIDDIKKAFPTLSEAGLRKRLKLCSDFKRTGTDFNWWVLRSDFRLPSEEELRTMVTPEQCCAHFSMMAASQRLKDAGYGDKFFLTTQEDDDEDGPMDDEEKLAPWNTTRAYIQAMDNKCLLQLTWPDDPAGCTKGFLYVRMPHKPVANKEEQEAQPKVVVNGTNADLRRLSLSKATAILRKHGLPDEDIKKLSRWEVIDAVRTVSTEKAKAGEKGMIFSRGNRYSTAELLERYREECQRLFDLQNKVMGSDAELSTDEDESSDEDNSELEEMGKNVEDILTLGKTVDEIDYEREELERLELQKTFLGDGPTTKEAPEQKDAQPELTGRVLMIYRTFEDAQGKQYVRQELVRNPEIIDAYLRIRKTKGEEFIKQFTAPDEQQKEEMRRDKKRIQEQLRRLKRNQEKGKQGTPSQPRKIKMKPDLKLKCGACGQVGHMRTNKGCPQFQNPIPAHSLTSIEEEEEEFEEQVFSEDEDLILVDGTKVKLSRKLIKHAEEVKRKSLILKLPKEVVQEAPKQVVKKRTRADSVTLYELPHRKQSNRQRKDPKVTLSTMLEEIVNEMRQMPDVDPFLLPVSKSVPNYHTIIQRPMDLQTIRRNVQQMKYSNREEFLVDVNQMVENSTLYNGGAHVYTITAKKILELCGQRLVEKEGQFMELEKAINPLLDGNEQVAFSHVLSNIIYGKLRQLPEAWPFLKPVSKKMVKDYYSIIKNPMDLETILQKIKAHKYQNRLAFVQDMMLILENCITYNGAQHEYTNKARSLVQTCQETLNEYEEVLTQLEHNIRSTDQKEADENDDELVEVGHDIEEENGTERLSENDLSLSSSDDSAPPPKRQKTDVIEVESSDKDEMGDTSTVIYMDVDDSDPEVLGSPEINDDKDVTDDLQVSDSSEEDEIFVDSPSYYDEDGDLRF